MTAYADDDSLGKIGDIAAAAGLRRITMLGWRDLDDAEAGGSELHASRVAAIWGQAGIEVTMRTSYVPGAGQVVAGLSLVIVPTKAERSKVAQFIPQVIAAAEKISRALTSHAPLISR